MTEKTVKGSLNRFEGGSNNNNSKYAGSNNNNSKYAIIYSDKDPDKKYNVPIELLDKNNIIKKEGIRVIIHLDENDKIESLEYDREYRKK